jgi:signal transduction histidine kinase
MVGQSLPQSLDPGRVQAFGGGVRGAFLLLRYVFIIAACYLLLFGTTAGARAPLSTGCMVALALGSNVALSCLRPAALTWFVTSVILISDALWVSWTLHATNAVGPEFFLLYVFVLFLAAAGRHVLVAVLGSVAVGLVHSAYVWDQTSDATIVLLRICFFFAVALFYGTVLTELRRERTRGDESLSWAHVLRREVAKATAELQFLYHQARSATRVRDEFVAAMSHELRTPIHVMLGYAAILAEGDHSATDVKDLATRIEHAGLRLKELVDGVLDLSRLDQGREPVDIATTCVATLMQDLRKRARSEPHPGVTVDWDVQPGLPALTTDAQKIAIVLENLLSNALKFTEHGAIVVSATHDPTADTVVFRVSDTGPGIPVALLPDLWEPFHASMPTPDGGARGSGLGLAITKRYVDLLGGTIRVRSKPDEGTCFEVGLPRRIPASAAPAVAA